MQHRFISEDEYQVLMQRMGKGGVVGTRYGNKVSPQYPQISRSRKREASLTVAGAGSNPAPSPFAPYANKWELNYSKVLEMEQRVGAIKSWKYSGLTFTTAYRQYHRIDFIIGHNDRSIELAQVKGYHKNMRAGIKGLKWAAQMYPMFTWTIKWWTGTGWDGKYVEV